MKPAIKRMVDTQRIRELSKPKKTMDPNHIDEFPRRISPEMVRALKADASILRVEAEEAATKVKKEAEKA